MGFADLLGGMVDDLIRGRTSSMSHRVRRYMATSAKEAVTDGVQKYQEDREKKASAEATREPDNEAWVLLLSMISAAGADGEIDEQERHSIVDKATRAELPEADMKKLEEALEKPLSAEEVAARVTSEDQKEQVYAMALAAITVDTEAEKAHLEKLKTALGLSPELSAELEQDLQG